MKSICLFLFFPLLVFSQPVLDNYERTSVSFSLMHVEDEKHGLKLVENFPNTKVNDKFNDHRIKSLESLKAPYSREYSYIDYTPQVHQLLMEQKAGKQIMAKWFSQNSAGEFSMDLIKQRGIYNATDAEIMSAKAQKRGLSALQDAGEKLLEKSYIIAFDFKYIETWDEYYDRQDLRQYEIAKATRTQPRKSYRLKVGYKGALTAYLFRLQWNDSISTQFYQKCWNNPEYFNSMNFSLTPVTTVELINIEGSQLRIEQSLSDQELVTKLLQNGIEAALVQFAKKYPHFRVRAPLHDTKPPKAKIGLKEDLKIDQRYFVYETYKTKKGELSSRKMGVIRASKYITDNRGVSTGETEPSIFYQESGRKLYAGMILEQRYDAGISISSGYAQRTFKGVFLRLDYNISKYTNSSLLKLFIEAQIGSQSFSYGPSSITKNLNSFHFMVGISKEYCMLRNIHLEPFIALQYDTTFLVGAPRVISNTINNNQSKTAISSFGLVLGLRMPINILHNLQLVPAASFSSIYLSSAYNNFSSQLLNELESNSGSGTGTSPPINLNQYPLKWDISLRYKF